MLIRDMMMHVLVQLEYNVTRSILQYALKMSHKFSFQVPLSS